MFFISVRSLPYSCDMLCSRRLFNEKLAVIVVKCWQEGDAEMVRTVAGTTGAAELTLYAKFSSAESLAECGAFLETQTEFLSLHVYVYDVLSCDLLVRALLNPVLQELVINDEFGKKTTTSLLPYQVPAEDFGASASAASGRPRRESPIVSTVLRAFAERLPAVASRLQVLDITTAQIPERELLLVLPRLRELRVLRLCGSNLQRMMPYEQHSLFARAALGLRVVSINHPQPQPAGCESCKYTEHIACEKRTRSYFPDGVRTFMESCGILGETFVADSKARVFIHGPCALVRPMPETARMLDILRARPRQQEPWKDLELLDFTVQEDPMPPRNAALRICGSLIAQQQAIERLIYHFSFRELELQQTEACLLMHSSAELVLKFLALEAEMPIIAAHLSAFLVQRNLATCADCWRHVMPESRLGFVALLCRHAARVLCLVSDAGDAADEPAIALTNDFRAIIGENAAGVRGHAAIAARAVGALADQSRAWLADSAVSANDSTDTARLSENTSLGASIVELFSGLPEYQQSSPAAVARRAVWLVTASRARLKLTLAEAQQSAVIARLLAAKTNVANTETVPVPFCKRVLEIVFGREISRNFTEQLAAYAAAEFLHASSQLPLLADIIWFCAHGGRAAPT